MTAIALVSLGFVLGMLYSAWVVRRQRERTGAQR